MNVTVRPPVMTYYIPENAPFSEEQRAWLSGFFAGMLAPDAPGPQSVELPPLPASADPAFRNPLDDGDDGDAPWHDPAMPITERMEIAAPRPLRRRMMAAMAQQDCGQCGYNCEDYSNAIALQAEERLNLCVPGGKDTARMLKKLIEEMGGGATDPDAAKAKAEAKEAAPPSDGRLGYSREHPVTARFVSRQKLNGEGSEKATWHTTFDLAGAGIDYVVGDSFGIYPTNSPALVAEIIKAIDAPADFPIGDKTLTDVLTHDMALGAAPDMLFEFISYMVGGERRMKAKALARGEDPDGDAATLDVLAAIHKFGTIRPDPEAFIECLEPLQPRLYSISSSPKPDPHHLSLTVDQVRYDIDGRTREGVASNFVSEHIEPGCDLKVYVQRAHNFALPADGAVPVIMVGPGTGIAPFRAFLHERMATKAEGGAWLFFGHQREACDYFYKDELEGMNASGVLHKLSLAWSRDAGPKTYVQDRMREEAAELWAWLQRGAHFYICGDAKRMASDVEKAMVHIAATEGGMDEAAAKAFVADLKKSGRYQADVY